MKLNILSKNLDETPPLWYNKTIEHVYTVGGESCSREGVNCSMIELIFKMIEAASQLAMIFKIMYDVHTTKRK